MGSGQSSEEDICRGCPLVKSKPENIAVELVGFVATAMNLSEVERIGGKFDYPDGLTAVEWETLRGLARGREKAEAMRQKRERKKR